MRKYLLLATVAGCLVSASAMAGGSIATDKQSAIINVKATVRVASELQNLQDMNFGTLYVLSGTTGDLASMDVAGNVTILNDGVVHKAGSPTKGHVQTIGAGGWGTLVITCSDGTGDPVNGSCSLGNGLALKSVVMDNNGAPNGSYGLDLGGTLTTTSAITQAKNIDAPGLKVQIQY